MKKKLFFYLTIILLVLSGLGYLILQYNYSNGQRVGKLVKLSRKGFFPKTYEGTLDLGSGDRLTWDFSVHKKELGDDLSKQTGKMVVLEYRELLWRLFYRTKYDVTSWKLQESSVSDNANLCRFVKVLRKSKALVEQIRPLIIKHDESLLKLIRECQVN